MGNFLGCKLNLTCSYRPQCNGIIERTHRTLKAALKDQEKPNDWLQNLPWVLLALRATPKSDRNVSSVQLTLARLFFFQDNFFLRLTSRHHKIKQNMLETLNLHYRLFVLFRLFGKEISVST